MDVEQDRTETPNTSKGVARFFQGGGGVDLDGNNYFRGSIPRLEAGLEGQYLNWVILL